MSELVDGCSFETERLSVRNSLNSDPGEPWPSAGLVDAVQTILTPGVTRWLPEGWQGEYSSARAQEWLLERHAESVVLEARERPQSDVIGMMLLSESGGDDGPIELRLGYMLAERAWGRGLATELVAGFVEWCRQRPESIVIVAGVEEGNVASVRVLERCGFERRDHDVTSGELVYELRPDPGT